MTKTIKALCVVVGLICAINAVPSKKNSSKVLAEGHLVKGVWAATLYSMDYPQSPTQSSASLKDTADALVEDVSSLGYNALFFQVRPTGDAFYPSEIFPWSRYLCGSEGTAPDENFDPLDYIVKAAHKKGISVHAWINPYRITASEADSDTLSEQSIAKKYPHLAVRHTDGKLYLNPGEPESISLVIEGALELVRNYDIDGIHMDDYFYPSSAFPDGETFTKYGGSFADIGDWRRSNTTRLVKDLGTAIKKENPDIIFSISPCGIWANKSSNPLGSDTAGRQAYYDYYADTRLWVKEELVDIIIPQVYWNIGYNIADFEKVSKWWNDVVKDTNVSLLIGQAAYRVAEETSPSSVWHKDSGLKELDRQKALISSLSAASGFVHYRLGSILDTPFLKDHLASANNQTPQLFSDINQFAWAKDAIENLYKKGIVSGMGDGTFGGQRNITRADFTIMLVRASGQKVPFTENFGDVTPDKYYYNEVGIAKALGYATGREDNLFDPAGNISRQDMATLAWRMLVRQGKLPDETRLSLSSKFVDANQISEYARIAVAIMTENNLLNGYETGEFKPFGLATRAECACLLSNILNLLE